MPATNVELYTRMIEAFNLEGVDGSMRYFAEDAEVYDPDAPADGTYRGRKAVGGFLAQLIEGMAEVEVRNFELVPAGDRVIGIIHSYGRAPNGGPELEMRDAHTLTFQDGKCVYWRVYLDPKEALADAGVGPEASEAPPTGS